LPENLARFLTGKNKWTTGERLGTILDREKKTPAVSGEEQTTAGARRNYKNLPASSGCLDK
jgi:hypothetical protein